MLDAFWFWLMRVYGQDRRRPVPWWLARRGLRGRQILSITRSQEWD
jgi:hypothetical protein